MFVITDRKDRRAAEERLAEFDIRYDRLILVPSLEAKAAAIHEQGILVYFDDQDEALLGISDGVNVLKVRNGGNFDFEDRMWLYSERTGKPV